MLHEASRRERIDHDLLRRYHHHGDLQARELLTERCMPLVRSVARRYLGRGQDMEDLMQSGLLGLTNAIERYDASTGHRFVTFAVPTIQGEIRRHFRDRTWAVHVPRAVQELDARAQRARTDIARDTGHEATVDDLAEILDVTTDEIRDARAAGRNYRALSLSRPAGEERTLAEVRGQIDPGYAQIDDRSVTRRAMRGLTARQRQIVRWRFEDGLLQREIAARVGVSQMQISRILTQALDRMREQLADCDPDAVAA